MYEFHKVGFYDGDGGIMAGWLFFIDSQGALDAYLNFLAQQNAQAWIDIANSPTNKEGHCRTTLANVMKYMLQQELKKSGKKCISMVEAVTLIERLRSKTVVKIFVEDGQVYGNKAGGCRPTHLRNDGRCDEFVFAKVVRKRFAFPEYNTKDVTIEKWQNGAHYYVMVDGTQVGNKFNTIKAAEDYKKLLLHGNP